MKKPEPDEPPSKGLVRYQVISAYVALEPGRGTRRTLLEQLAAREWTGPDGKPFRVAAETIRGWVRRFRVGGLAALADKPRPPIGVQALPTTVLAMACDLKRQVPERSLDRVIEILEDMGHVAKGDVKRATLHRGLKANGLSERKLRVPDTQDLDRFEAKAPNDLWQSDMLAGPMLPDPERPGETRRAWLYAFLDDHSRMLLHGRFSFKGDLPALELVFRRSLQKYGVPRRVYYDYVAWNIIVVLWRVRLCGEGADRRGGPGSWRRTRHISGLRGLRARPANPRPLHKTSNAVHRITRCSARTTRSARGSRRRRSRSATTPNISKRSRCGTAASSSSERSRLWCASTVESTPRTTRPTRRPPLRARRRTTSSTL